MIYLLIFRILWPVTHLLGRAQATLARWFRSGTWFEQFLILPVWFVCRILFIALLDVCEAVVIR